MSVLNEAYKVSYVGRGDTGPYPITFEATLDDGGNAEDIVVKLIDPEGTETDITATSTVTGLNVYTAASYAATYSVVLIRYPTLVQPYTFPYGTKFPSRTFERALDRLAFAIQRLALQSDQSLKGPLSEAAPGRLPTIIDRASKFLAFDAAGDPLAALGVPSVPATAWAATLLDDATLLEGQKTLGLIPSGASAVISAFIQGLLDDADAAAAHRTLSSVKSLTDEGYTILDADGYTHIKVSTGASDRTITLPARSTNTLRRLLIEKIDSGAGKVIVARAGSDTINGTTSWEITKQYGFVEVFDDNSEWRILKQQGSIYEFSDASLHTQASPAASTWYNLGSHSLTIPVAGSYLIEYDIHLLGSHAGIATMYLRATLATVNNGETHPEFTGRGAKGNTTATCTTLGCQLRRSARISIAGSTVFYLNEQVESGAGYSNIYESGNAHMTTIRAERIA